MAGEAELKVGSDSVKQLTVAVEALVKSLEKLGGASTQAEKKSDNLKKKQKKTNEEFKKGKKPVSKFQKQLKDLGNSAQLVTGPLGGVASRIAAIGRVAKGNKGAVAVVGLSVALALLAKSAVSTAEAADKAELRLKSLTAQVIATGAAAGISGDQLDAFARDLAFDTLDSVDGVVKLTQAMLTFKNISGETFRDSIMLSQDLGLAMNQDPVTAAKTLGKVLQNPLANYKQLKRAGIEFNATQLEDLKIANRRGDIIAAQKVITDKLKESVGGLAKAQADTFSGDKDTFSQKYDTLSETIGDKLLPNMRKLVQASNSVLGALQEWADTDVSKSMKKLVGDTKVYALSEDQLKEKIKETNEEWKKRLALVEKSKETDAGRGPGFINQNFVPSAADRTADEAEAARLVLKRYKDQLEAVIKSKEREIDLTTEAQTKTVEQSTAQVELQELLLAKYKETGDLRSTEYLTEKAEREANLKLKKLGLTEESELGDQLKENIHRLAEITEERIKLNTVLQIKKGLDNQENALAGELYLEHKKITKGLRENSKEYLKSQLAIEGQKRALSAGFEEGSKEYEAIVKSTNGLFAYKSELLDIANLKSVGLNAANGFSLATDEIVTARIELSNKLAIIDESEILNLKQKLEAKAAIRKEFAEKAREEIGVDVRIDSEGTESFISELQANEELKSEALAELRKFAKDNDLMQHEEYLRRKNEITEEYNQKEADIILKNHKATDAHKQRMRDVDLANGISTMAQNLSAVAGNNKKLAKLAKVAAMFSASASLVEALAQASKLPYPTNIPAYIQAGIQGTQLIQMAGSLNEPAFAFGGVDIQGSGTGRSDDISARISRGESVMTQAATSNHKDILRRMNAGLPVSGGSSGGGVSYSPSIIIQGDASEKTVAAIDERLAMYEDRVIEIARGTSLEVITEENEVGGVFDPI